MDLGLNNLQWLICHKTKTNTNLCFTLFSFFIFFIVFPFFLFSSVYFLFLSFALFLSSFFSFFIFLYFVLFSLTPFLSVSSFLHSNSHFLFFFLCFSFFFLCFSFFFLHHLFPLFPPHFLSISSFLLLSVYLFLVEANKISERFSRNNSIYYQNFTKKFLTDAIFVWRSTKSLMRFYQTSLRHLQHWRIHRGRLPSKIF